MAPLFTGSTVNWKITTHAPLNSGAMLLIGKSLRNAASPNLWHDNESRVQNGFPNITFI
jgi:hypothetical protein